MMKQLLSYILLGFTSFTYAQTLDKTVVGSGGESLSNGDIHLNLSLGEPLIGQISTDISLDQGFWAGSLRVEPMNPEEERAGILVFPNPVEDELNIFTNNQKVYGLTLFTVEGRLVFQKKVDESQTQHFLDASILTKGIYVLQVFVAGDSEEKLFKIIKQ